MSKSEDKYCALSAAKRKLLDGDDFESYKTSHSKGYDDYKNDSKSKKKKEKKKSKRKHKKKHRKQSSEESSSSSEDNDEWVEKRTEVKDLTKSDRDDWMSMTGAFATYTKKDLKPDEPQEKKLKGQIDAYNPSQSSRELNPYWRDGGTGLPSENKGRHIEMDKHSRGSSSSGKAPFKKPTHDDEYSSRYKETKHRDDYREPKLNWRKTTDSHGISRAKTSPESSRKEDSLVDASNTVHHTESVVQPNTGSCDYLSDEQMNAMGAKIVKAEIMGNKKLIAELTAKLEAARKYKKLHPEGPPAHLSEKEDVILSLTDDRGNTRPLAEPKLIGDPNSKGGKKKATTHSDSGDRMRFFADDDKHSLKEMFEREKFGNADEDEKEFANIVSRHKNPNDDLEDIFAECITKNKSGHKGELSKAISQHKSKERSMDNCEYCISSSKSIKHMIVSLGSKVYVALPTRKSLTTGHCYISTVVHAACSTMVDEDIWADVLSYRRALTRMFNSQDEDVVFFETASYLHKHPHLLIHCIPLPRTVGDTAPIYFKKALLECEAEWSNNKKVVDLRGKDIRKGIPRGLPYFWVDFGMDAGFAHVIEDQKLFPANFAQEIIGGMLDLDHSLWRKPVKESFEAQRKKVLQFTEEWKQFDPISKS